MKRLILLYGLLIAHTALADAPRLVITGPAGGVTCQREVALQGRVEGLATPTLLLRHNGLIREVPVFDGRFRVGVALFRGPNRLSLTARDGRTVVERRLTLNGRFAGEAMSVRLTWGPRADLDLLVREPSGRLVFHGNPRHPGAGFYGEVSRGQGPEIYRSRQLQVGVYQLFVRSVAGVDQVPVRANLSVSWLSGGKWRRRNWSLTLDRPGIVRRTLELKKPE